MIYDSRFTILKLAALALLSSFILHPSSLRAQGTLTPPGAPATTMKSLAQLELQKLTQEDNKLFEPPSDYFENQPLPF